MFVTVTGGSLRRCGKAPSWRLRAVRSARLVMKSPRDLRRQAERFLALKRGIGDQRTIEAINELVVEYHSMAETLESQAAASERLRRIRERAYRMWEEQGRPDGLHAHHWHAAEQEEETGGSQI
jgi:Protein of unknown function (DUF2934)